MDFYGIIIEQSLSDASILQEFAILGDKQVGSWRFLLVSASDEEIDQKMKQLQKHMIEIDEDCWYVHFFNDETLFVVYQDVIFRLSIHPDDWDEAIQHGLNHGVPIEQLDFKPRTAEDALAMFGLNDKRFE